MARLTYIGPSTDYRTNRWLCTCDCGKQFEPETTLRSTQRITCPKCQKQFFADYNSSPVLIVDFNNKGE